MFSTRLAPLPDYILPLGSSREELSRLLADSPCDILPAITDPSLLPKVLKSHPVKVAVIGDDWPAADREETLDQLALNLVSIIEWSDALRNDGALASALSAAFDRRNDRIGASFLQQLIDLMPDPVFFKDLHGRFLLANRALSLHFGAESVAVIIGRTDFDFFGREHASLARVDELEVMRGGEPVTAKLEEEDYHDGRPSTWCLTSKSPLRDESGRVIGIFGFSQDVTALRRTEALLATERHLIEAVLTGIPDAIFVKDRQARFLLANPPVAALMGTTPAGLRGKRDSDFCRADLAEKYRADEEEVMRSGLPMINREEKIVTPDGRELWFLTSKLPYRAPNGEVIGLIGIGRNVSARKSFSDELADAKQTIKTLRAEIAQLRGTPPS